MKRYLAGITLSTMLLLNTAALHNPASAAAMQPAAPILQESACILSCNRCSGYASCAACRFCQAVMATARPQATPAPTAKPTLRPTVKPTLSPTLRPVQQPTAAPTARPTVRPTVKPSISTGDYTTLSVTAQEQKALNLLNADRAANGLPPLALDSELSRIARIKSQDMRDNRYFAHTSPTYGNAAAMLKHFGYAYRGAGENIAHHATVEKSQAAFMSSNAHRRNILGSQWQKVGIGVAFDQQGFVYVTQLFVR